MKAFIYLDEFTVRNLIYTDAREDYPNLSDEQFANFRAVTAGRIAKGVLYRSASPVDPARNRNKYADKVCDKNGVFKKSLSDVFGADPENADLKKEAKEYFKNIGFPTVSLPPGAVLCTPRLII